MELSGTEWRLVVPRNVADARLPDDDKRTTFVACTMAPAINGEARFHWKITRSEVQEQCERAVGRPIIDSHNNDQVIGSIIAAGVDMLGRIWISGAIDYTLDGNAALARIRRKHYWGVSWRIEGISYQDPVDKLLCVEKSIRSISILSSPEYEDARIYFVADEPAPVKLIHLAGALDRAISASMDTAMKKQIALSTVTAAGRHTLDVNATPMSEQTTAAATTTTIPVVAVASGTPAATPTSAAGAATGAGTPVVVPTDAPVATPKASVVPQTEGTATQQQQQAPPPPPPVATQPSAPIITYNFGVPFGAQNQFGTPSSVPPVALPPTLPVAPMSTPATTTPAVDATAAAVAKPAETPAAVPVATTPVSQAILDDLRRSIVADMKLSIPDMLKTLVPPTPVAVAAASAVPAAATTSTTATAAAAAAVPSSTPVAQTPADKQAVVNIDAVHDGIKRVSQMRDEITEQETRLGSYTDMLPNDQRLAEEQKIEEMKNQLGEYVGALIEGVETHHKNYRETFGLKANQRVDNELARMKDAVAARKYLPQSDLNWLGLSLELTSESSGAHRRSNEERERLVAAQRQTLAASTASSLSGRYSDVAAFRQILSLDPRSVTGQKRQSDSNAAAAVAMPPPPKMSQTQAFRRKFGIPWTLVETSEVKHIPAPPRSLDSYRLPDSNARLFPPSALPDSLWANGLADSQHFAPYIQETAEQCSRGVAIEQELTPAAMAELAANK